MQISIFAYIINVVNKCVTAFLKIDLLILVIFTFNAS